MGAHGDIFDAEHMLKGDQPENVRETVFEKNREDFAVTRKVVIKIHRRPESIKNHSPTLAPEGLTGKVRNFVEARPPGCQVFLA